MMRDKHNIVEIIGRKRDGDTLTSEELHWVISAYTRGEIPDYQMSALLMAILFRRLDEGELAAWTEAMLHSGDVIDLSHIPGPKGDKHSTGGVGDKVSIPLAPIIAACGISIPMISGRGLGHTGGTLDKLESIPGFRTALTTEEFLAVIEAEGLVLAGQSETLAPADRLIYALRDATGTVPSIPLIASSIMSKKLAEGGDALVLDVKVGRGAFMKTLEDARYLAETMVAIGTAHQTVSVAVFTAMDQPLGREVGNACEIMESIDVLEGGGPQDLREVTYRLGGEMLMAAGLATDLDSAAASMDEAITSGRALERFAGVIEAQGGDPGVIEDRSLLPTARHRSQIKADRSGFVTKCDALDIGVAGVRLGGGRGRKEDAIDPGVGISVLKKLGEAVEAGDTLAEVRYNDGSRWTNAQGMLEGAWGIGAEPPDPYRLILGEVRSPI
jgi:pyrimidine-nucleoside phosphorylase